MLKEKTPKEHFLPSGMLSLVPGWLHWSSMAARTGRAATP